MNQEYVDWLKGIINQCIEDYRPGGGLGVGEQFYAKLLNDYMIAALQTKQVEVVPFNHNEPTWPHEC